MTTKDRAAIAAMIEATKVHNAAMCAAMMGIRSDEIGNAGLKKAHNAGVAVMDALYEALARH